VLGNLQAAKGQLFKTDESGQITGYQDYKPYSTDPNKYVAGFSALQKQAQQGAGALKMPGQFATATGMATSAGQGALGAGDQYNQMATDPGSMSQWMSPYMQNVTDYQTQQANRQYDISGAAQMGNAARSGAFGGSRDAIMAAENERNRNQGITGIQATGAQSAWQDARQAQQFGANLGLQGYQTAIQGSQQLGNLGTQQLAAQTDILGTKSKYGAEVQGRNQALIDQRIKNFENQQNQPYRAMDVMSGLVRGTPIAQSSSTQYAANPSYGQQIGSTIGALGSMYGAYKGKANGGIVQAYADGGSVEEGIEAKLRDMSPEQLRAHIPEITSQEELSIAKKILAEETMSQYARGGIVGYAEGGQLGWREQLESTQQEMKARDYKLHGWTDEDIANYKSSGRVPLDPAKQLETVPGEVSTSKGVKEPLRSTRLAPEVVPEVVPYESTLEPGKGISTEVKTPWQTESTLTGEEIKSGIKSAGKKVLKGLGTVGKGLGIAGATLGLAEAGSEVSELDNYLAVRARRGDESAKKILESGGSDPYLESLKKPVRDAINNMDVGSAWDYLKEKLTPEPSVSKPTEADKSETQAVADQMMPREKKGLGTISDIDAPAPSAGPRVGLAQTEQAQEGQVYPQEISKVYSEKGLDLPVQSSAYQPAEEVTQTAAPQAPADDGLGAYRATADKTPAQIMQERQAEMEKAGIKSSDQISAEQRKEIMDEKANAKDESKRQMYLRMAEFFSNWGSTPGLPLVAGLKAMKETLPSVMTDSKEDHAVMRSINKSLRDLDHATELEKAGQFEKAYEVKEQASAAILKHKEHVIDLGARREELNATLASHEKTAKIAAGASMYGADERASVARSATNNTGKNYNASPDIASLRDIRDDLKGIDVKIEDLSGSTSPEDVANLKELKATKKELLDEKVRLKNRMDSRGTSDQAPTQSSTRTNKNLSTMSQEERFAQQSKLGK